MELRYGKVETVTVVGEVIVKEVHKVRDYQTMQELRTYTLPVRVSSFEEVRREIDEALTMAEAGECLDVSVAVRVDSKTGLPKLVEKTIMDKASKV